jgi:hypothetical protein
MLTIKLAAVRFAMFVCAIAGLILMLYALAQIGEQGVAWLKTGEWAITPSLMCGQAQRFTLSV